MTPLRDLIDADLPYVTAIRHDLHRHPELGYQEHRTAEVVARELAVAGVEVQTGLAGGTGVRGLLRATRPGGRTIGLRADMDALPIHEETGLPYASTVPGKMHACGHDGHTAMLLGAARALAQAEDRPNDVVFVFQPAEEGGAGAAKMVADGALKGVDEIYGLHGWPALEVGQVATRSGAMMASADQFSAVIRGKGTHAAFPQYGIDPIVVAAHVITALQTIVSRNADPLAPMVVTIGICRAGTAHNVIPMEAHLEGTLRTLSAEDRELGMRRVREVVAGVSAAFGATGEVHFDETGYPATVNTPGAYARWKGLFPEAQPDLDPVMGAEDFSFYGRETEACFFALGVRPSGQDSYANLHAPTFDFNDEALPVGIEAFCRLARS